jgi:alpha-tubulin suppressor-like RCC1 family protein
MTCGVKTDGSLWCWGDGTNGLIGGTPARVGTETGWAGVSAGNITMCAWKGDGAAHCWASFNDQGILGTGQADSATDAALSVTVASFTLAGSSACAVDVSGRLWCWGSNATGVAGNGTIGNKRVPVRVAPGRTFDAVFAGQWNTCALAGGARYCTGYNWYPTLGDGTGSGRSALARIGPEADWTSLALGFVSAYGLRSGNELYGWGANSLNTLWTLPYWDSSPVALGAPGTWNRITAGDSHACAIRIDGTLDCWGANWVGELGDGTTTQRSAPTSLPGTWQAVAAGMGDTCGIKTDGTLRCWGRNSYGQLGVGDTIPAYFDPQPVGSLAGWSDVSLAYAHTCGIRGGSLYCWGDPSFGALGVIPSDPTIPTQVPSVPACSAVGTMDYSTCAITAGGALYCFGWGRYGELANGTVGRLDSPTQIGSATDWTALAAGRNHVCALRNGGELWCWGMNAHGELGDGEGFYASPQLVPRP